MVMPAVSPRYTIEMLDAMPQEPGVRYELVDGLLIVTPAPAFLHSVIVVRMVLFLGTAIPEIAARVGLPGEIRKGKGTSLEPDILVVPSKFPLKTAWKNVTEWWLAVEVVSPSSRRYDRVEKRKAYLDLGVPLYWIVDPELRTVDVWRPGDTDPLIIRDRLTWTAPSGHRVDIELEKLFEGVD